MDDFRREVTTLSRLKTLDAWRGDIVDEVISIVVINKIKNNKGLDIDNILWVADRRFNDQYTFAKNKRYREEGIAPSNCPEFAALLDIENDRPIEEGELKRVREDIHQSLRNFLENESLIDYLRSGSHWVAQRDLQYPVNRFKARGKPDLIVFFDNEPPHIFDWKVHSFATKTYQDQLLAYALALYKTNLNKPHIDFPSNLSDYELSDYKLTEYQLLINEVRDYSIVEEDVIATENEIASGLLSMYRIGAHKKYNECSDEDFPTALNPSSCERCSFKQICK